MVDENDDFLWGLVMRWLAVGDVGMARSVCKAWNEMLAPNREGGDLWKQICSNTHTERTLQAMADAMGSTNLDFYRVCKQFVAPKPSEISFRPELSLDDVFVVIELLADKTFLASDGSTKQRGVVQWSWTVLKPFCNEGPYPSSHVPASTDGHFEINNPFQSPNCLEGKDFSEGSDFVAHEAKSQYSKLKLTFFRKDKMKSVCMILDSRDYDFHNDGFLLDFCTPLRLNVPESSFRALNAVNDLLPLRFDCCLVIDFREDQKTLNLFRQAVSLSDEETDEEIYDERALEAQRILAGKAAIQVEVTECSFDIEKGTSRESVDDPDETACILDALCWN